MAIIHSHKSNYELNCFCAPFFLVHVVKLGNCCEVQNRNAQYYEVHNRNAQYYEVHNITPVTEPAADRRVTLHLYYLFRQNIRNSGKNTFCCYSRFSLLMTSGFLEAVVTLWPDWKLSQRVCQVCEGTFAAGKMRLFPWSPFFLRGSADFKDFATTRDLAAGGSKK